MDFTKIQCFLSVAHHLSFSRAAQDLYIAQSAVTQHIKGLEDQLGFKVLERTQRSVRLTPAGEKLRADLESLMDLYQRNVNSAHQLAMDSGRMLTVGYPGPPEWGNIPEFLRRFRLFHTDAVLYLKVDKGHTLAHAFALGGLDVLFGDMGYLVQLRETECTPLFQVKMHVIIPEGHPLSGRESVRPDEINQYPTYYIDSQTPDCTIKTISQRMFEAGVSPDNQVCVTHREDVLASVLSGMGIGVVPGNCRYTYPGITAAELDSEKVFINFGCAWRRQNNNRLVEAFIQEAQEFPWIGYRLQENEGNNGVHLRLV